MQASVAKFLAFLAAATWGAAEASSTPEAGVVRTLEQVRKMTRAEATSHPAIDLQATVLYYVPEHYRLYIQSGTAATYAFPLDSNLHLPLKRGDLVQFQGYVSEGDLSPSIRFSKFSVVSHPGLPTPEIFSFPAMANRAAECHWAHFQGRVLSAYPITPKDRWYESGTLRLVVDQGGSQVNVTVDYNRGLSAESLIGSTLSFDGVIGNLAQRGQFLGTIVFVQDSSDLKVVQRADVRLFNIPVQKIHDLLRYDGRAGDDRAHIQGVVISKGLTDSVFIQDDTQGILVETGQPVNFQLGDVVDVVGYPVPGQYSPVLRYPVFRKQDKRVRVLPARIDSLVIPYTPGRNYASTWLTHDGELVELTAELVGQSFSPNEVSLLLRSKAILFRAKLQSPDKRIMKLEIGSQLRLRGVCRILTFNVHHTPEGMELLLRSSDDVDLVQAPPWWTGMRILWIVLASAFASLFLFGWVVTLKSHVRAQTARLRDQTLQLYERATRDGLTKLWNRTEILERLNSELIAARQCCSPLTVVLIDLDRFKDINDTFGHQAGDRVLIEVSNRLAQQIRPSDSIGRYGGEELLVVLPGLKTGPDQARVEQMREAVAKSPVLFDGVPIVITCSAGVSWTQNGQESIDVLIKAADASLYRAKENGRNRVEFEQRQLSWQHDAV